MKLLILILLTAVSSFAQQKGWRATLGERLPYFGDGNWIVVADSAFPLHSTPGIETIVSDDSQLDTLRYLLNLLTREGHLRPVIYTDAELPRVAEEDAPGIDAFRQLLSALFEKLIPQPPVKVNPHFANVQTLEGTAKSLNVLVIKTKGILPYTSIFVELKPAYWPDEAEQRLRQPAQ